MIRTDGGIGAPEAVTSGPVEGSRGCGRTFPAPFFMPALSGVMLAAALVLLFPDTADAATAGGLRGLWVVRTDIATPERVRAVVEFADSLGFNALFVQVRGRGDAYYRSGTEPGPEEHPSIPATFDPLAAIIELAHTRDIEVHAWFNMNLAWSASRTPRNARHVLRAHPDWFMVSRSGLDSGVCPAESVSVGGVDGRFLSPGLGAVRNYLVDVVAEVVRNYSVDGVHFDYIRYPGREYDYRGEVRQGFLGTAGIDPAVIERDSLAAGFDRPMVNTWLAYRAESVTALVKTVSREVRGSRKGIRVSAAVKPDPGVAYERFGQDWPRWVREGAVDFVVLMSYFSRTEDFRTAIECAERAADPSRIAAGIAVHLTGADVAMDQAALPQTFGLKGFAVFSYSAARELPGIGKMLPGYQRKR